MRKRIGTYLSLGALVFYIAPMITVFVFDSFTLSQRAFYHYLDPFYLYDSLTSAMKYMVVWLCLSGMIVLLMTRSLAMLQNHDEHGSAHWADEHEINRIFTKRILYREGLKGGKESSGGMVVRKIGQRIWHECECIHSIIIGTTSSGKTRKTLIPSIMVATQAKVSDTKNLKLIILSKAAYGKYMSRMQRQDDFNIVGVFIFYHLKRFIENIKDAVTGFFHCKRNVIYISEKMTIDLNKYFDITDMEDIEQNFSCSGPVTIDENNILSARGTGKAKVTLHLIINKESFFVNDPKKELYKMYRNYLVEQGYHVILLDLRKQWTGDQWNPMSSVIRCLNEGNVDEADLYAKDIAAALCPESKASEKIWTDGERAIIAALILAVAGADCPEEQKNLYTCYQILGTLGQPDEDDHVPLNDYFNNLPVGHIARTAFGPAALATDRTRMSFYVSACATLGMFSSSLVAKQTMKSTFDMTQFSSKPTAVFLVNPDEKSNMDSLANLFIDEIYRVLSIKANETNGRLRRKFHYFWDETPASGKQGDFGKKLSIARGKNIQFHLYIQDFGQLEEIYGKEMTATIKANCNLMIYISTQNLETAKEISDKIGSKTIETESVSEQTGESVFLMHPHGNISRSLMARPLLNANELMKLEDGKAIVIRMRMNPMLTTLEDCSQYDFYDSLKFYLEEPVRNDGPLIAYIPEIESTDFHEDIGALNYRINKKI